MRGKACVVGRPARLTTPQLVPGVPERVSQNVEWQMVRREETRVFLSLRRTLDRLGLYSSRGRSAAWGKEIGRSREQEPGGRRTPLGARV